MFVRDGDGRFGLIVNDVKNDSEPAERSHGRRPVPLDPGGIAIATLTAGD